MKFSNSTGPLTWSLSEYPNLEQSKAVRQKIHLSLEIFIDWRCTWCTFSFESDHVHFTSPITPKMQYSERFHVSCDAICRPITHVLCIMKSEEIPKYQCSCSFSHKTSREKCHLIIKWGWIISKAVLLGNKANFLSEKLSLSVIFGAYNFPQYNFIFLSLFVADYISNHSHVALAAHVFVDERVYTCVLA